MQTITSRQNMQQIVPTSISVAPFGGTLNEDCKFFIERIEILAARERALDGNEAEADRARVLILAKFCIGKAGRFFDKLPEEKLRNWPELKEALIYRSQPMAGTMIQSKVVRECLLHC
jgi:hypothetical protein